MPGDKRAAGPPSRYSLVRSESYGAPAQLSAPGLLGVPVSVAGSNVENFDAGTLVSSTGPELVKVTSPVDGTARNVDRSECCSPGVCPGGFPRRSRTPSPP